MRALDPNNLGKMVSEVQAPKEGWRMMQYIYTRVNAMAEKALL